MNLAEFNETEVFVDTNIFVYALTKRHRYKSTCEALLLKVNQGDTIGFTSSNVISECEVAYDALDDIFESAVVILPLTLEVLQHAKTLSKKHNLLFSDAIHAGSCDVYGIKHIASNDKDFDRVDFLKRWIP